jgi:hypothetical protein
MSPADDVAAPVKVSANKSIERTAVLGEAEDQQRHEVGVDRASTPKP